MERTELQRAMDPGNIEGMAAELARLRAEIERLQAHLDGANQLDVARIQEIERLRALSQNNAHSWDAIVGERDRLRTEIELLHAELRVTKKLGLAALQDAMRQAGTGEER